MTNPSIRVITRGMTHTDKIAELQTILQEIVAFTRLEAGCWHDQREKIIESHFATPHIQQALIKITSLRVTTLPIKKYNSLI